MKPFRWLGPGALFTQRFSRATPRWLRWAAAQVALLSSLAMGAPALAQPAPMAAPNREFAIIQRTGDAGVAPPALPDSGAPHGRLVPDVLFKPVGEATNAIRAMDMMPKVLNPDAGTADTVVWEQSPKGGAPRPKKGVVELSVGPARVPVPQLETLPPSQVSSRLIESGLTLNPKSDLEGALFESQEPRAGTIVGVHSSVLVKFRSSPTRPTEDAATHPQRTIDVATSGDPVPPVLTQDVPLSFLWWWLLPGFVAVAGLGASLRRVFKGNKRRAQRPLGPAPSFLVRPLAPLAVGDGSRLRVEAWLKFEVRALGPLTAGGDVEVSR